MTPPPTDFPSYKTFHNGIHELHFFHKPFCKSSWLPVVTLPHTPLLGQSNPWPFPRQTSGPSPCPIPLLVLFPPSEITPSHSTALSPSLGFASPSRRDFLSYATPIHSVLQQVPSRNPVGPVSNLHFKMFFYHLQYLCSFRQKSFLIQLSFPCILT